ncbi:EAL domain-containing protein [Shewanella sp.]|uniref:putative bifunctional diguanylate cyclase/phosphodiesterase n=1 Tax=Shewanella sp. TaxID=50422 RepID=UPI00258799A8|nr:EAL domain-containing protein [Shewanella sp.]MCJ8304804.1 EAL domain-containing protein [Shewanella sp.]
MSNIPTNQNFSLLVTLFNALSQVRSEHHLNDALKQISTLISCECIFVFCISKVTNQVRLRHQSREFPIDVPKLEHALNHSDSFQHLLMKRCPEGYASTIFTDISSLTAQDKLLLEELNITSLLLLPMVTFQGQRYLLGAINPVGQQEWQQESIQLLELSAAFISIWEERARLACEYKKAENYSHELLYRLPLACAQVNGENKLTLYNHAAEELLKIKEWQPLVSLVRGDDTGILLDTLGLVRGGVLDQAWCELPVLCCDGKFNWLKLSFSVLPNESDQVLLVAEDVNDRHQLADELSFQTNFDHLTGLPNRAYFESYYSVDRGPEAKMPTFAAFLNLDRFQVVNNISGHKAGDKLLCQVAVRLKQLVRKGDVVSRLGGDEFGILMHAIDEEAASHIAERICEQLSQHDFVWDKRKHSVSVSMGVAAFSGVDEEISQVLARADAACRVVKERGRNSWCMYSSSDPQVDRRYTDMNASVDVVGALALDKFELYYQPIEPLLNDNDGLHLEILLRMLTEDGAIVSPSVFLPAAERYNLASRVDRWVIDNLLHWGGTHLDIWHDLSMVAINLSATSLDDSDFMNWLEIRLMAEPELVSKLCFEITETAAVSQLDLATALIDLVKPLGCKLALDDFGSGFSSFAYLKLLDIDFVKIDGQFVRHLCDDKSDQAIVTAICQLGRDMEFDIIAEFVESPEIGRRLKSLGVDFAQGYAIAKPAKLSTLTRGESLHWLMNELNGEQGSESDDQLTLASRG